MERIKAGIVGTGYIAASHIEAIRRLGFAECVAVAGSSGERAQQKAGEYYVPRHYDTVDELIDDPEIAVVHNCTPNNLHKEINEKIIRKGKHIFSEKPLAMNSGEAESMLRLLEEHKEVVHGVNYCYRMYPLVREIKARFEKGELGRPLLVHGSYLQDWLLYETDYNWRVEPESSGPSRCISDIGTHWMDAVQHMLGSKITEVCADLVTVFPVRKKPTGQVETFAANASGEYEEKQVVTEDYGAVMFKMDNGASGVFHVSEVSAGYGCSITIEIDGTKCAFRWNQEEGDRMWIGYRDRDNCLALRNPGQVDAKVQPYTHLAKGHPEGWNDAETSAVFAFYDFIRRGARIGEEVADFATFYDGAYEVKLVEAIVESSKRRGWVSV
ncbi:MAG: Gfo/Idh/MocA family oxidoreductase [Clostridiales bacterium]|nr:Gfo/Idh/MocA family oxidoreductase [Clostridiales bacterium]